MDATKECLMVMLSANGLLMVTKSSIEVEGRIEFGAIFTREVPTPPLLGAFVESQHLQWYSAVIFTNSRNQTVRNNNRSSN
jgi:hypothetical protein